MKKIFFLATLVCSILVCNAEKVHRVDDFKDGESKFGFEAKATKKYSVTMDGEYLVVTAKKDPWCMVGQKFPITVRQNFHLSYDLIFPKLDEDHIFGLVFNYEEDESRPEKSTGDVLCITENKFFLADQNGRKAGKVEKMKLKKGKNVPVHVDIEKKGKKMLISINGIDFEYEDLEISSPYMGFWVNEKNTMKVDKVTISQILSD